MGKKQMLKGKYAVLTAIISGTAVSIGTSLLGAAITAWAISAGKATQNAMGTAAWIVLFLSALCGSWVAAKLAEGKKLQTALISGGVYLSVLLAATALFFGGQYSGVWVGLILIAAAGMTTAMLTSRPGREGNKRAWKRRYR